MSSAFTLGTPGGNRATTTNGRSGNRATTTNGRSGNKPTTAANGRSGNKPTTAANGCSGTKPTIRALEQQNCGGLSKAFIDAFVDRYHKVVVPQLRKAKEELEKEVEEEEEDIKLKVRQNVERELQYDDQILEKGFSGQISHDDFISGLFDSLEIRDNKS